MTAAPPPLPPRRRTGTRLLKAGGTPERDLCRNRRIDRAREKRPDWVVRRMHDQKQSNTQPKGREQ